MISYDTDIQNTPEKAHNSDLIKIGISQGDTNGVGYELILKTFSDPGMLELCTPIIFGHVKVANFHRKTLGLNTPLQVIARAEDAVAEKLNQRRIWETLCRKWYGSIYFVRKSC